MNLARIFWEHLIRNESMVVLERLEADGTVSWRQTRGELRQEAAQWMAALHAAGIGPGDRVAVSLGKSSGLVTAHLAMLGVGAGVVPLNPALTARETEAVLQRAQVKLAITHRETIVRAPDIDQCRTRAVLGRSAKRTESRPAYPPLSGTFANPSGVEPVERGNDDLALFVFTSGTTGAPKGVGLTHGNLRANLQALLVETWEMKESDRLLHALPPHHVHGLGLGLYGSLMLAILLYCSNDLSQQWCCGRLGHNVLACLWGCRRCIIV